MTTGRYCAPVFLAEQRAQCRFSFDLSLLGSIGVWTDTISAVMGSASPLKRASLPWRQ
jgi:hypothetical protein